MKILILSVEDAIAKNQSKYSRVRYVNTAQEERSAVYFENVDIGSMKGKVCEATIKTGDLADKIESIVLLDKEDPKPFYRTTKLDVEKVFAEIMETVEKIKEPLKSIIKEIVKGPRADRFKNWPAAASVHHVFAGGLIEHTYGMLKMVDGVKDDPAHIGIDLDVVKAAVILHDIAKIATYDFEVGIAVKKNNLDTLLGHLVLADEMVTKVARDKGLSTVNGVVLNLRHCVLSHHGKKEWGSPIFPATREAILVHQLDMIQSRSQMALESVVNVKDGERSPYNRALEAEIVKL